MERGKLTEERRLGDLYAFQAYLEESFAILDAEFDEPDGLTERAIRLNRGVASVVVSFWRKRAELWKEAEESGLLQKDGVKDVYRRDDETIDVVDGKNFKHISIKERGLEARADLFDGGRVLPELELGKLGMRVTINGRGDQMNIIINVNESPFISSFGRTTDHGGAISVKRGKEGSKASRTETLRF